MTAKRKQRRGQRPSHQRTDTVAGPPKHSGATGEPPRQQQAEGVPVPVEKVRVQIDIAPAAHMVGPGQFLIVKPKPGTHPTLLVWIEETGMYQPVFIQPGAAWLLIEKSRHDSAVAAAAPPRLIIPR